MKLTVVEFNGDEKVFYSRTPKNKTLGKMFEKHLDKISGVQINEEFVEDWHDHVITKTDHYKIFGRPNVWIVPFIPLIISVVLSIVAAVLSILLAPKPKKPSSSKNQPALGVAGVSNTIAPGTPKFISYGTRRVYGHLIASKIDIFNPPDISQQPRGTGARADSAIAMSFSALYYMGVGKIADIREVKLNNTHLCDIYGPPQAYSRLGLENQSIIPGHELVHQTYADGRSLDVPSRDGKSHAPVKPGIPITYTTKGAVDRVTFFFQFPTGLWQFSVKSTRLTSFYVLKFLRKKNTDPPGEWTTVAYEESITTKTTEGFFWKIVHDLPDKDQYDFQINVERQSGAGSFEQKASIMLFNVMETQFIQTTYPGNALLEVHGIASEQITSFDQMQTSAIVDGRLVDVLKQGIYVKEFSRNRVWIIRDLMVNPTVGLGNRIHADSWDNASGLKAANYYEEDVLNFDDDLEQRDYCDVLVNDPRPGWDWIKTLLFEGRAILIPSGGRWKYLVDINKPWDKLYQSPGNIIEGTLQYETGNSEKPINTLRGEFPNIELDYASTPTKLNTTDIGDDPERPEQVSYVSLVRKSQVSREMNFYLKKRTLIKRRWVWRSPKEAIVSEPYDIDRLIYNLPKPLRGYAGFIAKDSTSSNIVTGKNIYVAPGLTYSVHVRHAGEIESSNITNATGTWSILALATPLSFTPSDGDLWAVGSVSTNNPLVQCDEVEWDDDKFILKYHEHVESLYDDVLTDVTALENAVELSTISPPPLLDAQAVGLSTSGAGYLFNVVPNFTFLSGTYSQLTTDTIILDSQEPTLDDFFTGAYIKADLDEPSRITDYVGSTRLVTVAEDFVLALTQSGIYAVSWPGFSEFYGFTVEGFTSIWNTLDTAVGTSLTVLTASTYSLFRFTPINANLVGNTNARVVVPAGHIDNNPPARPLKVKLTTNSIRSGIATVNLVMPLARDTQYLETLFMTGLTQGNTSFSVITDLSKSRDDTNSNTTLDFTVERDLSMFPFGTEITAKAATMDFFNNKSAYTTAFETIVLSADEPNAPPEIPIDTSGGGTGILTGGVRLTLFDDVIEGGTIGENNSIQLDLSLLVSPGSTLSTYVDFHFMYAGASASTIRANIANGVTEIADDSPYSLTFKVSSTGTVDSQATTVKKVGDEVPTDDINTDDSFLSGNSLLDQDLQVLADIVGDTTSTIVVVDATLSKILDDTSDPEAELGEQYIISGTVPGTPEASGRMLVHPVSELGIDLETNLAFSEGYCRTVPTSTVSFSLRRNGIEFGRMNFATGVTIATFIATHSIFSRRDVLEIVAPSATNAIEDVGWTIYGTKIF